MGNQSETRDGSAKSIFLDALEIASAGDRLAYLDRRCGADPALRAEVEALLLHHDRLEGYLERPALDPESMRCGINRPAEGPGTVIGPYKLLEQIGEGGMGQVYMAEQTEPVRRRVALKIIKPGMDSRQVVARFEAERQALALMDHPNIARVLDAGATASGRPYFIMELVRGVPITEYCDQAHLLVPQRLGLFVQVCQAVQHAHQKGVIHRDLKPSNVLVTLHDGVPVPKVIDFGIAKATGQQLTEKTLFTGFAQLVGTPLYMSPEQAEMSGLDVDTRSDIYSLGVLLYELLTGTTPFDQETFRKAAFDEVRRIIREDEPQSPSTRLRALGQTLTTVSAQRGTDPRRLGRAVRGELDWVVMKALEKDRNRRYETASGFAADVMRYLTDRPVEAVAPSARYRFRKFARRNRAALTTATVVVLALLAGTAVSTWQAIRATRAERQAAARYAQARRAVDEMYTQVAEKWLSEQPRLTKVQHDFLEKALAFYRDFAADPGSDPAVRYEAARAYNRVGLIGHAMGKEAESEAAYRQSVKILESLSASHPAELEYRLELVRVYKRLGEDPLTGASRYREAERSFRRGLALSEELLRDAPHDPRVRNVLAGCCTGLGYLFLETGRPGESEQSMRRGLELCESLAAESPVQDEDQKELAYALHSMTAAVGANGRGQEAEPLQRRAIAIYEKLVARSPAKEYRELLGLAHTNLGRVLASTGNHEEAELSYRRAVTLFERLAADFPEGVWSSNQARLGDAYLTLGKYLRYRAAGDDGRLAEAEAAYSKAVAIYEGLTATTPDAPNYWKKLASVHEASGHLLSSTERPGKAERAYGRAEEILDRLVNKFHDGDPSVLAMQTRIQNDVGELLVKLGRTREAEESFRRAIAVANRLAADHPDVPAYRNSLAWSLATCPVPDVRDPARAVDSARKALETAPKNGGFWNTLGVALYRAKDWRGAIEALEKSTRLRNGGDGNDWFFLAMSHWQLGDRSQARTLYDRAVGWMEKNQPGNEELRRFREEAEALRGLAAGPSPDAKDGPQSKGEQRSP